MAAATVNWARGEQRRARLEAELRRILGELPPLGVEKAILFGSLASGHVGQTSDPDLLLVAPSEERFARRLERFYQTLNPSVAVDLFVYTPEEFSEMSEANPFVRSAIARGKVVYERHSLFVAWVPRSSASAAPTSCPGPIRSSTPGPTTGASATHTR